MEKEAGRNQSSPIGPSRSQIRVLIVEDSSVIREFLAHILAADPEIEVAGIARDGREAVDAVERFKPDVITMDVHMPIMDGYEATKLIMRENPTPIVIVSGSVETQEVGSSFKALEAGALAIVRRPPGLNNGEFNSAVKDLVRTIKLMSEVKVVRRFARPVERAAPHVPPERGERPRIENADIRVVAIGASTGGPAALSQILSNMSKDVPYPILITQHITTGFLQGFVDWLGSSSGFPVRIGTSGEHLLPGCAYLAPDGFHMGVAAGPTILLSDNPPEQGLRPSIDFLFRTVAREFGPKAVGVLLTGMGKDGAAELKLMKEKGAITIAQDAESCVVHGMPGEAIKLGGATHILPPEKIAEMLSFLGRK